MENLNNVPSTGTFGGSVSTINSNFDLVVNAINSLEYQTTRSKGILNYGQNPATVFPNAVAGDWCMILSQGNVFPATIKTFNGSTWSGSGTWNPDGVDLTQYAQKSEMTTAIANSLAQATARMGYGECTVNGTALTVSIPNFILPTSGGTIHIKMSAVGTGASTLNINSTGAKTLWYNGKAVSSTNTWEQGEIISVFYDGTRYMSSNSQGGGGNASKIKYDNSQSGIDAENVQGALDEVKNDLVTIDNINASLSIIDGYVLRPNNTVVSASGYSYCDYYDISKSIGKLIKISADVYVSTQSAYDSAVILYNSNKVVTRSIKARTIAGTTTSGTYGIDNYEITVQEGEKYIRIGSHSTNIGLKCIGELRNGLHEVVNEISALNNKIDSLDTVSDVNVQLNVIDGYVLRPNNSVVSSNGYSYCDYYDISKSVGKIIKVTTNAWVSSQAAYDSAVILYNSNKVVTRSIKARTIAGTTTSGMYRVVDYPVTVQDDEKYIRISSKNSSSGGMNLICDGSISDGFAEMKSLGQKIGVVSEEIGLHTMASYRGEKIYLGTPRYDYSLLMNLASCSDSRQGGAVYGNYFFQFHNTNAVIQMYDLSTGSLIQTFSLPAITNCHSSSGGFGFFYDVSDPLPLLYISGMNDRKIYVYRFTGSIGSLSIALHQTINLPSGSDLMYMPSVAIDRENRKMVLFGYTKNSWNSPTDNKSVIAYLNIPSNSGDITVDVNDVIGKSYMEFIWAEQSAFARLGKLYMAWGNTGESQGGGLYVIDYQEGIILSDINMVGVISVEPEALCLWGNTIILSTQSGIVYKLEF